MRKYLTPTFTADYLREVLDYDPSTGIFIWSKSPLRGGAITGRVAGKVEAFGYRRIKMKGVLYAAHRLAWMYVYGEWPPLQLDHINRQRDDNRISNLRMATASQNAANRARPKANATSRFKGVTWHKGCAKWQSLITHNGKSIYLGLYESEEEAARAYRDEAARRFGEFSEAAP